MNKKQEITRILNSVASYHDFERAIEAIGKLQNDDNEIFNILWPRAIKPQSSGSHVLISALALYKLNINCPLSPQEAIEQVCNDWDISIEEVPWYLANQFSKKTILDLTENLRFDKEKQNIILNTINYWIKKHDLIQSTSK